jgi:serine/threonine-protein kinase
MTANDTVSWKGARFGPFQLMRLMDNVGFGEVYEAEDTRNQRVVILKMIPQESSADAIFRAGMHREADTVERLRTPHIVPIDEYGDIDGQFYIAMPMTAGTSLRALLTDQGLLSPAHAVFIVRQIAAALDASHARGVHYHDVKPENILVTNGYFACLLDLGMADAVNDLTMSASETAGCACNYMAPEWFRSTSGEVGYRADIYSLACVLSECVIGIPPYLADDVEQLMAAQSIGPAPRPSQLRPGWISPALDAVVARGMLPDPAQRYRSAEDLAAAAHRALTTAEQHAQTVLEQQGDNETLLADTGGLGTYNRGSGAEPEPVDVAASQCRDWGDVAATRPGTWNRSVEGLRHSERLSSSHPSPALWSQTPAAHPGSRCAHPSVASDFEQWVVLTHPRDRRKPWAIVGAAAILVVVVTVVAGLAISHSSSPSQQATKQTVLPFNGFSFRLSPGAVAVDNSGTVYVTNQGMYGRVVTLAAGSSTTSVEQFRGLYEPQGVAVDSANAMYVTDFNNRVVKLTAGSSGQIELPFAGLNYPEGVAVDNQGSVYVADRGNNRVVKLPAGSTSQMVLPFDGLINPDGVAVDDADNVYVTDTDNSRVVRLDSWSNNQSVLPFPGLNGPWGIAVDDVGDVFVTERDTNTVMKLAAGSSTPTLLPFTDLNTPLAVAVDKAGNVYVANRGDDSVLKLAP